ncbi:transglutaminase family protein [Pseudooceanicola sp. HF7]|uniref:transglutaminase family protein n=1 Tax=Pseudooceanicola sp. HF7 TaxID=2721560 RepID=UPI0014318099|nr:transglutaminase family protein [Pseudooceanicola sp. HF7]NIZ08426.1 transglutaminase family protein [Pseudooceanicola sp. HF7]
MLYSITLRISYKYDSPAEVGRHVLRVLPLEIPGQQNVLSAELTCDPQPSETCTRRDFFGNTCTEISYRENQERTEFTMRAQVRRHQPEGIFDVSSRRPGFRAELSSQMALGPLSPYHFLPASPRVPDHDGIARWAADVADGADTAFATVDAICRALHRDMTFDPTATLVDTPVAEAFALRRGVCQDFTHIAICALRSLGIPAGYVSGFLRTLPPEGQARLEGADAMHAWVRAWCGKDMGWVEFDPTNAVLAGDDHVVIAHGRDYFDVAPVKGALRIAGGQSTRQAVDMISIEDPSWA